MMARETQCQTPGCQYSIQIDQTSVAITVKPLPISQLDAAQAELLENNLHNALEMVLARYFEGGEKWPLQNDSDS